MGWARVFDTVEQRVALLKLSVIRCSHLEVGVGSWIPGLACTGQNPGLAGPPISRVSRRFSEALKTSGRFSEVGHFGPLNASENWTQRLSEVALRTVFRGSGFHLGVSGFQAPCTLQATSLSRTMN